MHKPAARYCSIRCTGLDQRRRERLRKAARERLRQAALEQQSGRRAGRCPLPGCGQWAYDLDAHMTASHPEPAELRSLAGESGVTLPWA